MVAELLYLIYALVDSGDNISSLNHSSWSCYPLVMSCSVHSGDNISSLDHSSWSCYPFVMSCSRFSLHPHVALSVHPTPPAMFKWIKTSYFIQLRECSWSCLSLKQLKVLRTHSTDTDLKAIVSGRPTRYLLEYQPRGYQVSPSCKAKFR